MGSPIQKIGAAEDPPRRNAFYQDGYRKALAVAILSVAVNLVQGFGNYWLITHRPPPRFFATDAGGRLTELQPLSAPMVKTRKVLSFATEAVGAVNSFDFVNYRAQLTEAGEYFQPDAWEKFREAMHSSGTIRLVEDRRYVVSSQPTGAPILLEEGLMNGVYSWRVKFPFTVTYQSANEVKNVGRMALVTVSRVSVTERDSGIAVVSLVVTDT